MHSGPCVAAGGRGDTGGGLICGNLLQYCGSAVKIRANRESNKWLSRADIKTKAAKALLAKL